ncbi:hypothetical protein DPEC_G00328900 [Dallia pectoralis]|uniref:Uncharacterized protein n=1 Tax=Dallia pectoralis TaxID=75939 RepID=A0ACC2F8K0_DALPE|nr:hypothetical protein DPEC_G00328900 [Dallia pectoralis]
MLLAYTIRCRIQSSSRHSVQLSAASGYTRIPPPSTNPSRRFVMGPYRLSPLESLLATDSKQFFNIWGAGVSPLLVLTFLGVIQPGTRSPRNAKGRQITNV